MKLNKMKGLVASLFLASFVMQPAVASSCETCSGGLENLVLQYDGGQPGDYIEVKAADDTIIFSGTADANGYIALGQGAVVPVSDNSSDSSSDSNSDDSSDSSSDSNSDDSSDSSSDSNSDDSSSDSNSDDSSDSSSDTTDPVVTVSGTDGPALSVSTSEISIYVNGNLNGSIKTDCSSPIGAGLVVGNFTVVNGSSVDAGNLCEVTYVAMPVSTGTAGTASCCDGNVTTLTLTYRGAGGLVDVLQNSGSIFSQTLFNGDTFVLNGVDANGTLGGSITLMVDGEVNATVFTSCSIPVGPGLIAGDFIVVSGKSLNAGALCALGSNATEATVCEEPVTTVDCALDPFNAACTTTTTTAVDCALDPFNAACTTTTTTVDCALDPFNAACTTTTTVDCALDPFNAACNG